MSETVIVTPQVTNVTVTQTQPAVIVSASGPQGPTGAQGATGATGAQGPKGDTGSSGVIAATSPLAYNASTQTVSLTYANLQVDGGAA